MEATLTPPQPTITVNKAELYARLGRSYSTSLPRTSFSSVPHPSFAATEEFGDLCFQFGIELDEDTTEEVEKAKKSGRKLEEGEGEAQLKIEIPANR